MTGEQRVQRRRGRHRRAVPVPARWGWFWLVTAPVWLQLGVRPFTGRRSAAYDIALLVLAVGFVGYLAVFLLNRRRQLTPRRVGEQADGETSSTRADDEKEGGQGGS